MQLFITYAHENIATVRGLVDILTAGGHFVWFDEQLRPGQDWKRELGDKIAACDAYVYALTQSTVDSEWCDWEFATAVRQKKSVIPVLLESEVGIPESLKRLQYADFTQGATGIAVAKLMGALLSFQKVAPEESPTPTADPKGIPSRAWESSRHWTDIITSPQHKPQSEAEEVVGKFTANLFRGAKAVDGRIILTNQRLLFEAHLLSIWREPLAIPLGDIREVVTCNTLGIVPNGITVQCNSGQEYQFGLWNRKRVISLIEQQRRNSTR